MDFFTAVPWVKHLSIFFGAIIGCILIALTFNALFRRRAIRQKSVIQNFDFPASVNHRVKERYPHLTDTEMMLALKQLRLYFLLCWKSDLTDLALPSRIVDTCWHAFIQETRSYQSFCHQAYGRFLHHTPNRWMALHQNMSEVDENKSTKINLKDGARVYQAALALIDIVSSSNQSPSTSPKVPLLFAIDKQLNIPDGYVYSDEILHLLATFDWQKSRSTDSGQDRSNGGSMDMGCGDGSISCGSCGGSH